MHSASRSEHRWLGDLGRIAAETLATVRFGTPLALDQRWREAQAKEQAARDTLDCRGVRQYQADKARRIHDALIAGRGH